MEERARRRKEILERAIAPWAFDGYMVHFQGDRMAQLIKPADRSGCLLLLLLLAFWPAAIFYYVAVRDKHVLIEVHDDLSVTATEPSSPRDNVLWVVITAAAILGILSIVIVAGLLAAT